MNDLERRAPMVPYIDTIGSELHFDELSESSTGTLPSLPAVTQEEQVKAAPMTQYVYSRVTDNEMLPIRSLQARSEIPKPFSAKQHSPPSIPTATDLDDQGSRDVLVAVMGATGTGKSTFIELLTHDNKIHIGHHPESETFDIQTAHYIDERTGRRMVLVDTPGFDDSREGVTDTDILEKIVRFLEPEDGEGRKLSGIIYMHRISDPRVGGVARKNLRMFQALCGEHNLRNVRIVTTNWRRLSKEEGIERQNALESSTFRAVLDGGAQMYRHSDTIESAQRIMSHFITLPPITTQIQEELRDGKTLGDTSAGSVLTAEMRAMQKKHEKELIDLKKELEEATKAKSDVLRAELEQERKAIEEKMTRADLDQRRLDRTLERARADLAVDQQKMAEMREKIDQESTTLRDRQGEIEQETRRLREEIQAAQTLRQKMERSMREATASHDRQMEEIAEKHDATMKAIAAQHRESDDVLNKEHEEKVRSTGRMEEYTREYEERIRQAKDREQSLQHAAHQARRKQKDLERRLDELKQEKKDIDERKCRGGFGGAVADSVHDSMYVGEQVGKVVGNVLGSVVGTVVAVPVAVFKAFGH